ncbi:unnamed protein product [marine sediment metagenome]|uniref:Uncharacterized protein n=1 Tax=marine sediment metagenome TaxID=412755 RepID=X1G6E4_9ZZZZ
MASDRIGGGGADAAEGEQEASRGRSGRRRGLEGATAKATALVGLSILAKGFDLRLSEVGGAIANPPGGVVGKGSVRYGILMLRILLRYGFQMLCFRIRI